MSRGLHAIAALLLLAVPGCGEGDVGEAQGLVGGDAASGRRIIARLGCGS